MPTTVSTSRLTALLQHLINFPTVSSDQATNRAALDWVEQQLHGLPLRIQRLENGGYPALIATTPAVLDPKNPKLWLAAHMDVVAGTPEDFEPRVEAGRLYGRGTHDMKYAIAVYVALLHELGPKLASYDLGLMLTCDEEVGGEDGVAWLVGQQGYRGDVVLLPDSSTPWKIASGCKGVMRWKLSADGQAAHASRPWQGINAIDEIVKFVNHVRANAPAEPCGDPKHAHATVNFSTITGGSAVNQVPGSATAQLDIRFLPNLSFDDITGWIEAAKAAVPTVSATSSGLAAPFEIANHPSIQRFKAIAEAVSGRDITYHTAHGSSDARFFAAKGIPAIDIGIEGSGYHTSPEWVEIADLHRFYEVTRRFVLEQSQP